MAQVLIAAIFSGLLLQLSAPGIEWWWVTGPALTPALWVLKDRPWRAWLLAGLVVGTMNGACLVDGGAKFGAAVSLFFLAFAALQVALPFALAGWIAPRIPRSTRALSFAISWTLFVWVVDELLYTPVLLGAPLSLHSAEALMLVERVGIVGLEAAVVTLAASLACLPSTPRPLLAWAATIPLLLLVPVSSPSGGQAKLIGVQPNIHWSDFSASGWSLERRQAVERTLDQLTEDAARRAGPSGTIVWPENGNGLANPQLSRRRDRLRTLLGDTGADLLAPGREFDEGREHLAVFRFKDGRVTDRARKANLVPIAESGLEPGEMGVIQTNAGPLGIAVCYDAMFSAHMRGLVQAGAQALVVTTDDTSFGRSSIPRRHLSYAVLRAAEVGRALLFVSNEGPSVGYDPRSKTARAHSRGDARTVYEVELPKSRARTPALLGLRHAIALLALLALIAVLRSAETSVKKPRLSRAWIGAWSLALIVGVPSEFLQRAARCRGGLGALLNDLNYRARGHAGIDSLGPMFKQSKEQSCGAAALAFALTRLGDLVFEERLLEQLKPSAKGTSLGALGRAANARGFSAQAWSAKRLADLQHGPGIIHVLHLSWDHYVVVFEKSGDMLHLFDPAVGTVLRVKAEAVQARWTGYALSVSHRPPPLKRPSS